MSSIACDSHKTGSILPLTSNQKLDDFAELRQEFPHLVAHVLGVSAHVAAFVEAGDLLVGEVVERVLAGLSMM